MKGEDPPSLANEGKAYVGKGGDASPTMAIFRTSLARSALFIGVPGNEVLGCLPT
jgi:hypothetical protein